MPKTLNYNQLAKQKELENRLADLGQARQQLISELTDLNPSFSLPAALPSSDNQAELFDQELKYLNQVQQDTLDFLDTQEITDILEQAREGSRFIALERRLAADPAWLKTQDLSQIQNEQVHYQRQVLETFDYLLKYFAQFSDNLQVTLPQAAERFYNQVVADFASEFATLLQSATSLRTQIDQENKLLQKTQHQLQRHLRNLEEKIDHKLASTSTDFTGVLLKNQDYQTLLSQAKVSRALINSLLNEINLIINQGLSFLTQNQALLESILGQNKVTRQMLDFFTQPHLDFDKDTWFAQVDNRLSSFDTQVMAVLRQEIEKHLADRPDQNQLDKLRAAIEEIIQFQEYLGQIFADSLHVLTSNLADLEQKRSWYGQIVLAHLSN